MDAYGIVMGQVGAKPDQNPSLVLKVLEEPLKEKYKHD